MREFNVKNLIFSSSATVYGQPRSVPIKEDLMYSNHRGHGQTITKGIDIKKMMAELLGKSTFLLG